MRGCGKNVSNMDFNPLALALFVRRSNIF